MSLSTVSRSDPPNVSGGEVIRAWYQQNIQTAGSPFSAAQEAYQKAIDLFNTTLTKDERKRTWLDTKPTMQDVLAAVEVAKTEYDTRKRKGSGKVEEYLSAFSKRLVYYGAIMDTLSQHHPEYVSLAWGAMKFVFVVVLNHEELFAGITKTLVRIADVLPRAELHLILYPTHAMLTAVSEVYAHIIKFIEYSIRWFKQGKLKHSIGAIWKPFQMTGKEAAENVAESSRRVDMLASAASKAELRELHLKVIELTAFAAESRILNSRISTDVNTISRGYIAHVKSIPCFKIIPDANKLLEYNRALRNRHRLRYGQHDYASLAPSLSKWASSSAEVLLLAQARHDPKSPRFFAVDLIDLMQEAEAPVLWALPGIGGSNKETTITDVLRSLTLQALQLDRANSSSIYPQQISAPEVETARTDDEWLALLRKAVQGLDTLFVVICLDLLEGTQSITQRRAVEVLSRFIWQCENRLRVKVILTARKLASHFDQDERDEEKGDHIHVYTDPKGSRSARSSGGLQRGKGAIVRGSRGVVKAKRAVLALRPVIEVNNSAPGSLNF